MIKIIWFTNSHEHRNHLLKYGFMKLHESKKIQFIENDNLQLLDYNVSLKLKNHVHQHTSFFLYQNGNLKKKILIDSEDSFIHLCHLIKDVDLYFCAAYNTDFHIDKKFIQKYQWQTEDDVIEYAQKSQSLILEFGDYFHKIRKFIPIGPNSAYDIKHTYIENKIKNIRFKLTKNILKERYWLDEFKMFEARYKHLHQLRNQKLLYDVVLYDTLWGGWPRHRYSLHQKLQDLSQDYKIYSVLNWHDTSENSEFVKEQFPLISNHIKGNYEEMLASSRLGVFATGFHWGWRNIMTLALFFGIPVYMDQPIFEPYFDFQRFRVFYNQDSWQSLSSYLDHIDENTWLSIKQYNQTVYDKYLSPEKVAEYVINTIDSQ